MIKHISGTGKAIYHVLRSSGHKKVVEEATCRTTEAWWKLLLPSLCGYAWVMAWASFLVGEDPGD